MSSNVQFFLRKLYQKSPIPESGNFRLSGCQRPLLPPRAFISNWFRIFGCCLSMGWMVCDRVSHSLSTSKRFPCEFSFSFGLHHIWWDFVSVVAITSFCEDLTESLWMAIADQETRLLTLPISEFPRVFRLALTRQSRPFYCSGTPPPLRLCANALTLITDTDGNVFDSFTSVK
jgi:hypothetical protein